MEYTPFAGLTVLDPDESIGTDNASFQSRNPLIEDRLVQIGAVTHRHNGAPALGNPSAVPGASAVAQGGALPAATTLYVGFTIRDLHGGETTISPIQTVTTEDPIDPPSSAPSGTVDYTAGGLPADTFYYAMSWLDAEGGETPLSDAIVVERDPGQASGRVLFTDLTAGMASAGASAWRLWKATGGGDFFAIGSGAGDTFTDDGNQWGDPTLAPVAPNQNFTNGANQLRVQVSDPLIAQASAFSVYVATVADFSMPSLMGTYDPSASGTVLTFNDLIPEGSRPPDVSTCVPSPGKVDALSEIANLSWLPPVATAADLPQASAGAACMTLDDGHIHRFVSGAWHDDPAGSGASGGATGSGAADGPMQLGDAEEWDEAGAAVIRLVGDTRQDSAWSYSDPLTGALAAGWTTPSDFQQSGGSAVPGNSTAGFDTVSPFSPNNVEVHAGGFDVSMRYFIRAATWHRVGVAVQSGYAGLYALVNKDRGALEICRKNTAAQSSSANDPGDFIVLASIAAGGPEGWTMPTAGQSGYLDFSRTDNTLTITEVRELADGSGYDWANEHTFSVALPADLVASYGTGNTNHLAGVPAIAWHADDTASLAFQNWSAQSTDRRRRLHAVFTDESGSQQDYLLIDELGRSLERNVSEPGCNLGGDFSGSVSYYFDRTRVYLQGWITANASGAVRFDNGTGFVPGGSQSAPVQDVRFPVIDNNGAVNEAIFHQDGTATLARATAGVVTYHLDHVSWQTYGE